MIVFTEGRLVDEPLELRLERVIEKYNPKSIVLREKYLSDAEYMDIAKKVIKITSENKVDLYLNRVSIAKILGVKNIHLSFRELTIFNDYDYFLDISCSVHSVEEAREAFKKGVNRLVTGHIFKTDCKKDLEPRGLEYLKSVVNSVDIPVCAIGGINRENYSLCLGVGANDFCIMSSAMTLKF